MSSAERRRLIVEGQVQGVGFRPFVYRLALEQGLTGLVGNTSEGVHIEVQGAGERLDAFVAALRNELPPLARITACRVEALAPVEGEEAFSIALSHGQGGHKVLISPDVSVCADCQADMTDPANRRYHYPFTNCTNCGPRYTITRAIPYDRATTSMSCFPLCAQCQAEYDNPLDRRFHAQPNACPVCGPKVWAVREGACVGEGEAALEAIAQSLRKGLVVAIKGLGGFHLSCDALSSVAVALLRERKNRPHKPLAVMVPDMDTARQLAQVGEAEEALLTSAERPIVLCQSKGILPEGIAPDTSNIGLVLPYTPLHFILFKQYMKLLPKGALAALVMTSGNAGGEPICLGNREALERLDRIADIYLLHNRDILIRNDDSVLGPGIFYRRARGYVPRPVRLGQTGPCVLGVGPELKATLCLTRGDAAFVSQHVGDLQNLETLAFYEEVAAHLESILEVRPEAVVHDLHPDFLSTAFAQRLAEERGIPCFALQHHFAHAWSVLTENAHEGQALVLALDGTGLGEDGTVWGGELLWVDTLAVAHKRVGRLRPFALPGGEAAIREPWRMAVGLGADVSAAHMGASEAAVQAVAEMVGRGVHCPQTSSAGRLFDAVAAGLGLCARTSYEGQAAIRLEAAQEALAWARGGAGGGEALRVAVQKSNNLWELDSVALFRIALAVREDVALAARNFHVALAQSFVDMAVLAAEEMGVRVVGLAGGVMQNATLLALLREGLAQRGLRVLVHRELPANDGSVALGQAAWGRKRLMLGLG